MSWKTIGLYVAIFAAAWYIGKKGWLSNVPVVGPVLSAL